MPRSLRLLLPVAALLAGAALAGCGSDAATGDKGYVDGKGVITVLPSSERRAPEAVAGKTLQGKDVSLDQFAGKPVVVNVWASWCAPCRAESGLLNDASKSLGSDVAFLGINVRDPGSTDRPLAFERRLGVTYPSLYDPAGRTLLAFHGNVTLASIPSTVVIDSQGRVAASIIGAVPSARTLEDLVTDVERGTA
jgi:thiol-disulfide isomerase/thioredoxin